MNKIDMLIEVLKVLPSSEGWECRDITNTKVIMWHPVHGRTVCTVLGKQVNVRGGIPG